MKKKIDATENPSRLENASARALSADRSEQASRPGTFSTMMSDRVIFSSASARIVAAEQVKGNKIAAMKPGADTSLASAANWKTTNGSNLSFGNFHGKSCMKTVGAGSSNGTFGSGGKLSRHHKKLAKSPNYYLNITNFIRLKKQLYEKDATDHNCAGALRRMQRERCQ